MKSKPSSKNIKKHFIIGGLTRAGKTIFTKELQKKRSISRVPCDTLVFAFQSVFPQLNIRHSGLPYETICDNFAPFLLEFIRKIETKDNFFYAIDTFHIQPRHLASKVDLDKFEVLFFGYAAASAEAKSREIERYAEKVGCWTKEIGLVGPELRKSVAEYIERSKDLKRECKKFGFKFIDTSKDFSGTTKKISR